MQVVPLDPSRLQVAAALICRAQEDPDTNIAYLSSSADAIATELTGLDPDGLGGNLVAVEDGSVIGVLGIEHDDDPPWVWWHGPVVAPEVDFDSVADLLYLTACDRLPTHVSREEVFVDERTETLARFAERHGFQVEEGAAALRAALPLADPQPSIMVVEPDRTQRQQATELHSRWFGDSHSTADHALRAAPDRICLVAVEGDSVIGYLAAEVQADGDGYLDFLGVDEAHRGRGIAKALVISACDILHREHACTGAHLTVRASNHAARSVYTGVGFVEERILIPWVKQRRQPT